MILEFGQWAPDMPDWQNPGLINAQNVYPRAETYEPLNSLQSFTTALTGACLGSFWAKGSDGTTNVFAGDANNLYKLNTSGDTWVNESSGGASAYVATHWDFAQFGDRVIAVDINEEPQYWDIGSSSDFALLPGSPPKAKYVDVVRDFVVMGNINDGAAKPDYVEWSGFNNSQLWTASLATQSDQQELLGRGGDIQGIVGGEEGYIFQQNAIRVMTYEGPPRVFRIDNVVPDEGTPAPDSIVRFGDQVWFYEHGGFKIFNGRTATPIGNNRVDRWFNGQVGELTTIQGVVDRTNRVVMWAFKSNSTLTNPDCLIIYNYAADRWAHAIIEIQRLAEYHAPSGGLTIDSSALVIDNEVGRLIDTVTGGDDTITITAFAPDNKMSTFEGTPLTAEFITREISAEGHRMETNSIRPLIDGASATVQACIGHRNTQQSAVTFTPARSLNSIGEANIRKNARYQRYKITVAGGFNEAVGLDLRQRRAGRR